MIDLSNSEVLFSAEQIGARVRELGQQLTLDFFKSEQPVFVAVMQGALVFYADLIRCVSLEVACDFISVSSYQDSSTPVTEPQLLLGPRQDWRDRDVVFVEAIVDSGKTGQLLLELAKKQAARSACICSLLDKPSRRQCDLVPAYVGFSIPNLFVVGYGLDYCGLKRNLSHIQAIILQEPGS